MRDFVFVMSAVIFFAAAIAYVWACERLK